MSYTLNFSQPELKALSMAIHTVIRAGQKKEPEMKQHSLEYKVLAKTKAIQEVLNTAAKVFELNPDKPEVAVELTRTQLKVAVTTIITIYTMQEKTLKQYEALPDTHAAFEDVEGRRRSDYMGRLKERMADVEAVANKLKELV